MPDPDCYDSLEDGPEVEVRVRGSRFVGRAWTVTGEPDARERVATVRKRYHDATHHCWAVVSGAPGGDHERFDDDGEPSGTAGRPILAAIRGRRLHDVAVVVSRWFGGTKLGTGGLARAYGEAAAAALDAAPRRVVRLTACIEVTFHYGDLGIVEAALARSGKDVHAVERSFDPNPAMTITVGRSRASSVAAALVEATAGRATVETG